MKKGRQEVVMEFAHNVKSILGNSLKKIILYGSCARGDYHENSDIDIMILTTLTDEEIERLEVQIFDIAFDFQIDYGFDISVVVKNEEHFNYWLGVMPFYDNVVKEGVIIDG